MLNQPMNQPHPDAEYINPLDQSAHPKAKITIRGKGERITKEDRSTITDWLGNAEAVDFIEVHVYRGGYYLPMTVQVADVVAVEVNV